MTCWKHSVRKLMFSLVFSSFLRLAKELKAQQPDFPDVTSGAYVIEVISRTPAEAWVFHFILLFPFYFSVHCVLSSHRGIRVQDMDRILLYPESFISKAQVAHLASAGFSYVKAGTRVHAGWLQTCFCRLYSVCGTVFATQACWKQTAATHLRKQQAEFVFLLSAWFMQNIDGTQEEPLIVLTARYGKFTSDFKAAVLLFGNILEAGSKNRKMSVSHPERPARSGREDKLLQS